ncbi:GNAT family N-acetyltransferase [Bacillus sp. AK128]
MVELRAVNREEKKILENLFEYYVYEFSPIINIDVSSEGNYGFGKIEEYFSNPNFYPYFIMEEQQLAGFCIVEKMVEKDFDYRIDQFFILKKYGNKGVGKAAAIKAFELFRGDWQITQTETNYRAQAFWRKVIKEYSQNTFEESYDEQRRSVQTFTN